MTIHLVYPHGPRIAAPWSIGRELGRRLRRAGHEVVQHDWDAGGAIQPNPGDILIGHPHDSGGCRFCDSIGKEWRKRIAIAPWNGTEEYTARLERVRVRCDTVFAICGPYWGDKFPAGWGRVRRLEMAIDPNDYPVVKTLWANPGQRRFLFIGCTLPMKGVEYLSEVCAAAQVHLGHIGPGTVPGAQEHGYLDLGTDAAKALISSYDYLISASTNDANPTTILEAACWGLGLIYTDESGWGNSFRHFRIPAAQRRVAAGVIRKANEEPTASLPQRQRFNRKAAERFTWSVFTERVLSALKD